MKCHQRIQICSFALLLLRLLPVSFVFEAASAFADTRITRTGPRTGPRTGVHRPTDTVRSSPLCNGNADENSNTGEYQDAFGRTVEKHGGSDRNDGDDPLLEAACKTQINLDPLVVCGPSGVGKGTVIECLRNRFPADVFGFSVSHTTRHPRPGEVHGQHYYFTNQEDIQREIDEGKFVEHAHVHGNYYGTSKKAIEVLQSENKITILDIDMQGVISVKESGIPARYVFIAPPSMEELEQRLRGRGTETEEAVQRRLGNAAKELDYGEREGNFDRVFVNKDVEETVDEMVKVLEEWFPQLKEARAGSDSPVEEASPDNVDVKPIGKQESSPPANSRQQKYDIMAESDKMLHFPSVRVGHDSLEVTDRSADTIQEIFPEDGKRKSHGYYVVDLEEPTNPRNSPKLGKTNLNIVLDSKEDATEN